MTTATRSTPLFAEHLTVEKMPAHWLFARLGKRVLRPGGLETTRWLLDAAEIGRGGSVVELAPGLGVTAREILARGPESYVGVERDAEALAFARRALDAAGATGARLVAGDAAKIPLEDASADVVIGEAMLSMQPEQKKRAILTEASRLLRPGGRYAIHELAVGPAEVDEVALARIEADLSKAIHVGVRIGTIDRWRELLEAHGFEVEAVKVAPMRLLEPDRLLRDEGLLGTARFALNAVRTPGAISRLRSVRGAFRAHMNELCAVGLVARRCPPMARER